MEAFANTVTTILTHHREVLCFNKLLDSFTQRAQADTWFDHLDGQIEALLCHAAQAFAQNSWFADDEHFGGVAMKAIFNHGNVDIDDIAIFQDFFITWDTVADDLIH
ncbi:Uncharacterised protein [Yersinia enterocolitica]|nr:Uncharacterised protein [Yersinia enterocolitica]